MKFTGTQDYVATGDLTVAVNAAVLLERPLLIKGEPGTGKTELTIWLAGYLRVPLYRLSLNDSRLSDQVFAQLVSPTSLQHDNAVIQIDEFQDTLRRWQHNDSEAGVSISSRTPRG